MSSKVNINDKQKQETSYPCLMISEQGQSMLFTGSRKEINVNGLLCNIGHYSTSWNMDDFKLFIGSVILENK